MKKRIRKLILKKETLVHLEHVMGGVTPLSNSCPYSNLGTCETCVSCPLTTSPKPKTYTC